MFFYHCVIGEMHEGDGEAEENREAEGKREHERRGGREDGRDRQVGMFPP